MHTTAFPAKSCGSSPPPSDGDHQLAEGVALLDDTAFLAVSTNGDPEDQDPVVYAVDIETGDQLWRTGTPDLPTTFIAGLFVHDGRVYVNLSYRPARILDPETGSVVSRRDSVVVNRAGGELHAGSFYAVWNDEVVSHPIGGDGGGWSAPVGGWVRHRPAVDNGLVVVGTREGTIQAHERQTGTKRWETSIDRAVRRIELGASHVVVADEQTGLTVHDRDTGTVVHRSTHEVEDVAVYDDTILIGGSDIAAYFVE